MTTFIQPDLPFPVKRSPIAIPRVGDRIVEGVGDRIVEVDTARSIRREGIFIKKVQYLGATFWEVEGGETFLPKATTVLTQSYNNSTNKT